MPEPKFMSAIDQICEEKGLPKERVIETVEAALAAAWRKDFGNKDQDVSVELDVKTGATKVFVNKEIVEEVEDEERQMTLKDAQKIKKSYKTGDVVKIPQKASGDYGRIAAQTAKQVIIQRIREAERDIVMDEYKSKEGELLNGVVQRIEGRNVIVDIGRTNGIMYPGSQVEEERYRIGQRMKFYVEKVDQGNKGPVITVSRNHPGLVEKLFWLEVPEISAGTVEIKSVAREAGSRTKISVASSQEGVDPVGSCVGQRGTRVQAVIAELGEEKIDVILWDEDQAKYITNALSPAKVISVDVDEKEKTASVIVPEDQLSLAIGKGGQNVRLAAKLTGWKIDVKGEGEGAVEKKEESGKKSKKETESKEGKKAAKKGIKKTEEKVPTIAKGDVGIPTAPTQKVRSSDQGIGASVGKKETKKDTKKTDEKKSVAEEKEKEPTPEKPEKEKTEEPAEQKESEESKAQDKQKKDK